MSIITPCAPHSTRTYVPVLGAHYEPRSEFIYPTCTITGSLGRYSEQSGADNNGYTGTCHRTTPSRMDVSVSKQLPAVLGVACFSHVAPSPRVCAPPPPALTWVPPVQTVAKSISPHTCPLPSSGLQDLHVTVLWSPPGLEFPVGRPVL